LRLVLRELKSYTWRPGVLGLVYELHFGRQRLDVKRRVYKAVRRDSASEPVHLKDDEGRRYWAYRDRLYWEDEGLTPRDVAALVFEREQRRERQLERAHAVMSGADQSATRREPIPREIRVAVWERDGGRCVECAATFDLQYDHIIPLARGGATTVGNLQVLCAPCNGRKGDGP
jgi:5-methylcytosine-specific restriction endonuclease McrA